MVKKMMKGLALALAAGLLLAGCSGGNGKTENAGGSQPASSAATGAAPTDLKVFAVWSGAGDLATNTFTKLLEDKFNVRFQWDAVPTGAAKEKRLLTLASGDYPDFYLLDRSYDVFTPTDLLRYSQQGVIVPLNDLIDQYAPNIKSALEQYPYLKAAVTAPDGNIYGMSKMNECFHCMYPNKMWLNQEWMDKLHLAMPTTPDEFKKVLEAFKSGDPNGNGAADEIPLSGSINTAGTHVIPYFMNAYIYDDDVTYLTLQDGKVGFSPNQDQWREGLKFVASMYKEGLIDPGAFTQNDEALKKLGDRDNPQILGGAASHHPAIFVTTGTDNDKTFVPVPPLTGPSGTQLTAYRDGTRVDAMFAITSKATPEKQIAAIKILDYLFTTEGQINGTFGVKGVDWEDPAPGDEGLNNVKPIIKRIVKDPGAAPTNNAWGGIAQYFQPKSFRDAWVTAKDTTAPEGYERRLYEATLKYEKFKPTEVFPFWSLWTDNADADEVAMLRQNINNYVDESALQFVTGAKSLDKDWNAYVDGFKKLNLDRYLELMQKSYDVSFKK